MDMACYGKTDEEVRRELDRRRNLEVRNIGVSPLFVIGKRYNIDRSSPKYLQEDENGTMSPAWNHCFVTFESKWLDREDSADIGTERWSKQAYDFPTLEKAELAKQYLESK